MVVYTIQEIELLKQIIGEIQETIGQQDIFLMKVHGSLGIIIKHKATHYLKKYLCIDDYPEYTGEGFNRVLFTAPIDKLRDYIPHASHLGKAIIEWRLQLNK